MHSRILSSPPLAADLFVGFLYATAAQAIIFGYLTHSQNRSIKGAAVTVFCLFFLGSDWVSRYRVRLQFEDETKFSYWTNFLKFSLEIMTLFCLAMALEGYIRSHEINLTLSGFFRSPGTAFGIFALFSAAWNLLLLYKLKISLWRLLKASLQGTLDTLEEVRPYVRRIYNLQESLASRAQQALSADNDSGRQISTLKLASGLIRDHFTIAARRSLIVTTGEIIVIHITLGNLVAGIAILFSNTILAGAPLIRRTPIFVGDLELSLVPFLLLVLFVPSILLSFGYGVAGRGPHSDFLGCLLSWILIVGLYASSGSTILVILLAVQQVIASNILGHWMTSPRAEAPNEKASPSAEA